MSRSPQRELRVGWPAVALGAFSVLHYLLVFGSAAPFFTMGLGAGETPPYYVPAVAFLPSMLITVVLAVLVVVRARRVAPGTRGRVRLFVLAGGAVLRSLGDVALAVVLSLAMTDPTALSLGLGLGESVMPVGQAPQLWESFVLVTSAQGTYAFLILAAPRSRARSCTPGSTCWAWRAPAPRSKRRSSG